MKALTLPRSVLCHVMTLATHLARQVDLFTSANTFFALYLYFALLHAWFNNSAGFFTKIISNLFPSGHHVEPYIYRRRKKKENKTETKLEEEKKPCNVPRTVQIFERKITFGSSRKEKKKEKEEWKEGSGSSLLKGRDYKGGREGEEV